MNSFYTPKQLAEMFQVDVEKVREEIKVGNIEAIRIGRQYRIPVQAFRDFIRNCRVKGLPRLKKTKRAATG